MKTWHQLILFKSGLKVQGYTKVAGCHGKSINVSTSLHGSKVALPL